MEHNRQIAVLQVWAIILVCLGHSLFNPHATLYLHRWIYAFHMPLFMFLSGYLLVYTQNRKNKTIGDIVLFGQEYFFWKKVKRLLLPYFFISTLVYIPKYFLSAYALRPVGLSFQSYMHMLLYPWDNVIKFFWFLPTLFIITILTVILIKMVCCKQNNVFFYGIVFTVLLLLREYNPLEGVKFLNLEGVVEYWLFFWSGILFFFLQSRIEGCLKLKQWWAGVLLCAVFSSLVFYFPDVQIPFVRVLYVYLGILFSFSLSGMYLKYKAHFADHLFGSSYTIYLFSWFPLVAVQFVDKRMLLPWGMSLVIALLLQIYVSFFVYKFLFRIKHKSRLGGWVATLLGQ